MGRYAGTIGVYGMGRFGSFWAEKLADFCDVVGSSRSGREAPEGVKTVTEEEVFKQPVIILCSSISSLEEILKRVGSQIKPGTIVMDTCSVKTYPVRWMEKYLPEGVDIIASHPMFGPDSCENGLSGLPIVLSLIRGQLKNYRDIKSLFEEMGLDIKEMTPEEHDKEMAYSQGVTHLMGRVLNELSLKKSPVATKGYRSLLEIIENTCNDSWNLFVDIQKFNPYTKGMRERLHQGLNKIVAEFDSIEVSGEIDG